MKHSNNCLPKIDYNHWSNQNEYFHDTPLLETVRQGLDHAKRGGLIAHLLNDEKIKTNAELVALISKRIQSYKSVMEFSDVELLTIFDLIQGWGGRTGRSPYVKPQLAPVRLHWEPLAKAYRDSVRICFNKPFDHKQMLVMLTNIPQVGVSFATKHMFFWTEYGPMREAVPIYDTRIKILLRFSANTAVNFESFVTALKELSNKTNMPVSLIERALFSFSQNYFANNSLEIKPKLLDLTDIEIAKDLEQNYIAYHSSQPS